MHAAQSDCKRRPWLTLRELYLSVKRTSFMRKTDIHLKVLGWLSLAINSTILRKRDRNAEFFFSEFYYKNLRKRQASFLQKVLDSLRLITIQLQVFTVG